MMLNLYELFVGLRFTRAKRRNRFISFISLISMLGIALGVTVLITVMSVMNGFRVEMLRQITAGTSTLFVLNDRPDLAALAHADGVHVGQDELSVKEVRAIVGPEMLIGVSTHSIEQARRAVLDGANYLGCGPMFPSGTKEFRELPGIDFLRQVSQEISLPAFAIGGITAENLRLVRAAGFCRVAVSGAVADATEPVAAARQLLALLAE